jgi:hypothetical protein
MMADVPERHPTVVLAEFFHFRRMLLIDRSYEARYLLNM